MSGLHAHDEEHDRVPRPPQVTDGVRVTGEDVGRAEERAESVDHLHHLGPARADLRAGGNHVDTQGPCVAPIHEHGLGGHAGLAGVDIGDRELAPGARLGPDEEHRLPHPRGLLPERKAQRHAIDGLDALDPDRDVVEPLGKGRGELEGLDAPAGDPQVRVGHVDALGGGAEEADQQAALEDHQEHGEGDAHDGDQEAEAVVIEVAPGQPHRTLCGPSSGAASSPAPGGGPVSGPGDHGHTDRVRRSSCHRHPSRKRPWNAKYSGSMIWGDHFCL